MYCRCHQRHMHCEDRLCSTWKSVLRRKSYPVSWDVWTAPCLTGWGWLWWQSPGNGEQHSSTRQRRLNSRPLTLHSNSVLTACTVRSTLCSKWMTIWELKGSIFVPFLAGVKTVICSHQNTLPWSWGQSTSHLAGSVSEERAEILTTLVSFHSIWSQEAPRPRHSGFLEDCPAHSNSSCCLVSCLGLLKGSTADVALQWSRWREVCTKVQNSRFFKSKT